MGGFKKFLLRGNLVDLAVAFVIGAAFAALVTAFIEDLITPIIAAIGGQPDFGALAFHVNGSKFSYGSFLNALIAFTLIAAVIYFFVVKPFSALLDRYQKAPDPDAPTRDCPECLSSIPAAASRCAFCTAQSTPVVSSAPIA